MKLCEAKGCEAQLTRAKYCNKHRLRFLRHGDPNYRVKVAKGEWDGVMCSAKDCDREAKVKGVCKMHYCRDSRLSKRGIQLSNRILND